MSRAGQTGTGLNVGPGEGLWRLRMVHGGEYQNAHLDGPWHRLCRSWFHNEVHYGKQGMKSGGGGLVCSLENCYSYWGGMKYQYNFNLFFLVKVIKHF